MVFLLQLACWSFWRNLPSFFFARYDHEQGGTLTLKHEGLGVMSFLIHLHGVDMRPSEIRAENWCILVAAPGQGRGKYSVSENSVMKMSVTKHAVIGMKSVCQFWICHVPYTTLCGALYCLLCLMQRDTPKWVKGRWSTKLFELRLSYPLEHAAQEWRQNCCCLWPQWQCKLPRLTIPQ